MNTIDIIGKDCYGCRACEQLCPTDAINMVEDKEGFLYPVIDYNKCIDCGLCLKRCPVKLEKTDDSYDKTFYGFKANDKENIVNSASGGCSDVIVRYILNKEGIAIGASYNKDMVVQHIIVDNLDDAIKLQSSKYVQSNTLKTYTSVKDNLNKGIKVLFTGTPCQVAGLYSYLGKNYENLYTLDVICHGVPSPLFFKKYIAFKENLYGQKILSYNFRDKEKKGWGTNYKIQTKTKTYRQNLITDKYGNHFMLGDCYRECCYKCKFASLNHPADITVGDFWGVFKTHSSFADKLGVSSIMINSKKGEFLLNEIEHSANIIQIEKQEFLLKQDNLKNPTNRHVDRDEFYKNIEDVNFIKNINVGLQIKQRIKSLLPSKIIFYLKK